MKTYRSIKRRMQSRFMSEGVLATKLFLISSKKSDQDFIEQYVETVKDEPTVLVVDEAQWNVKPPGTFSNKRFKVAVGDKKLHSRIIHKGEDLQAIVKQGYRIIDVPLELRKDFERDVDSSLMEFAGISSSMVSKFISYDTISGAYGKRKNPFTNNVISIGTNDDLLIQDFFKPKLIDPRVISKPIFIHIDTSLTGDRTGISGVAAMGIREQERYSSEENNYMSIQELVYQHLFTVGIQCPSGSEISLEKNRQFVYYLKYELGWNIQGVSADGFQSADSKQQFIQSGFNARILSLDRTPEGYLYLKASLNEKRIDTLEIPELEKEIINLERNNMTGKVDHPPASSGGSKDMSDSFAGALKNASELTDRSALYIEDDFIAISETNEDTLSDTEDLFISNLKNDMIKESTKPKNLQDIISNTINNIKNNQDEYIEIADKKRMDSIKSKLSPSERSIVSDDELESAYFNRGVDDDILIW